MKRSMIRTGCIACALLLVVSQRPFAAYAGALGSLPAETAAMETVAAETATAQSVPEITPEEIDAFFDNSVFVGDSVMLDFRNYSIARKDTWLGRLQFLAAVSFSTYSALRPVMENTSSTGITNG